MDIRQSYRESTVQGATPLDLVVRLYEQMIEDLRQALKAIEQNNIELRTNRVNHAILVLGCLQSQLDFEAGGKVAAKLNQFYDRVRQNLMFIQFHPSTTGMAQEITDLLAVREAWIEVERAERPSSPPISPHFAAAPLLESELATREAMDWKG